MVSTRKKVESANKVPRLQLANAIRALAMDAVEAANSGHPGMPMGMADIAEVLWNDYLRHSPGNPLWFDRDRFVLSNGHGSMLLYALAYLTGYPLSIEEIKNFRQLGYRTAGHPERDLEIGIETTTGPVWHWLRNCLLLDSTIQDMKSLITTPTYSWVMAVSWKAFPMKLALLPVPLVLES